MKEAEHRIWNDIKSVNRDLPAYKRISHIEMREEEFEKTSTHKIQRFKIKHR